ncbi:hypothetical protein CYMTET_15908 [Cymbomonas tetramitiformis]|uniref:Uncharacterized protein n=1 Tax=Cymbomonas tetramitiformis TaxID=36881 RepID=A0AAE0GD97_9CHLO|nr:hypothetical protein CYMTET_15908 [Cymbomonas tetramitiformis]
MLRSIMAKDPLQYRSIEEETFVKILFTTKLHDSLPRLREHNAVYAHSSKQSLPKRQPIISIFRRIVGDLMTPSALSLRNWNTREAAAPLSEEQYAVGLAAIDSKWWSNGHDRLNSSQPGFKGVPGPPFSIPFTRPLETNVIVRKG